MVGQLGVRGRLLLAFLGISGFSILAAAAGLYAFQQVGERLSLIDERVPIVASSMELSRSAERIIATADNLSGATTRERRDEISARMEPEVQALQTALSNLKESTTSNPTLVLIEQLITSFRSNLAELSLLVTRRLSASEQLDDLRQILFHTNDETQQLFAPWLQIIDMQVSGVPNKPLVSKYRSKACASKASISSLGKEARSMLADASFWRLKAENAQAYPLIRSADFLRYSMSGWRTVVLTVSTDSPTKVCNISETRPLPGCPEARQALR